MAEWVLDITPGWAVEESIENLGSSGKASLLPGITIVALLAAAALGNASLRISRRIGIAGFTAFGLLGRLYHGTKSDLAGVAKLVLVAGGGRFGHRHSPLFIEPPQALAPRRTSYRRDLSQIPSIPRQVAALSWVGRLAPVPSPSADLHSPKG